MREIKFRAWDTEKKEWLFGYEYPSLGGFSMFGEVMMMGEYAELLSNYFPQRIKDIELMQYTGLKDKNGKEIYEGDVIEYEDQWWSRDGDNNREEVKWNDENASYAHFAAGDWTVGPDEVEVIGNMYENPELLTRTP